MAPTSVTAPFESSAQTGIVSQAGAAPDRIAPPTVGQAMAQDTQQHSGIEYAPGVPGKYLFRVRETYVAGPAADLIRSRRVGALKLDLVLRGLALLPEHSGNRKPGHVLRHRGRLSYQVLHDLCRDPARFAQEAPHDIEDDAVVIENKRTWIREQIQALEARQLVQRSRDPRGRRPEITVLRDRCDGEPFDDPGATATATDGYVTISGAVISSPLFRDWGAPEVVAYLCAMTADRFARHRHRKRSGEVTPPGSATWFRQADWFNSKNPSAPRPPGHVPYPFSTTTIQRGLRALCDQGLITAKRTTINPDTRQRFASGPRKIYQNRFAELRQAEIIDLDTYRASAAS